MQLASVKEKGVYSMTCNTSSMNLFDYYIKDLECLLFSLKFKVLIFYINLSV